MYLTFVVVPFNIGRTRGEGNSGAIRDEDIAVCSVQNFFVEVKCDGVLHAAIVKVFLIFHFSDGQGFVLGGNLSCDRDRFIGGL